MGQVLVRELDDVVKAKLQHRAKQHGRSMEAEIREILRDAVKASDAPAKGLGSDIAALFAGVGLDDSEQINEMKGFAMKDPFAP